VSGFSYVPYSFDDVVSQLQTAIDPTTKNLTLLKGLPVRDALVAPPSVKIYPLGAQASEPTDVGISSDYFVGQESSESVFHDSPALLASLKMRLGVHAYGKDYDNAEQLLFALFSALHSVASCGRARILQYEFEEGDGGVDVAGVACVGIFEFDTYLPEQKLPLDWTSAAGSTFVVEAVEPDTSTSPDAGELQWGKDT
jgi:hypothetical protein